MMSTNSTDAAFLGNHVETPPAAPSDPSSLTLRPSPPPENGTPEPTSVEPAPASDTFNLINPDNQVEDLAAHLLVVYNQDDFNSRILAQYYASKRNIPAERVLPLSCSLEEEITRAEFEKTIREPILLYLLRKNWMARQNVVMRMGSRAINLLVATRNDIWAIVLIRGVPLKIAPDPSDDDAMEREPALQTNAAAVDSELALLPVFGFPHGGFVPNVFFDQRGSGLHRLGADLAKNMILVTRLDGPTPEQVRRMIDDSLRAEKNRLAGLAVVDTRNITDVKSGYFSGDAWLRNSRNLLLRDGWTVKFDDKPDVLPATDPCNQVALYLGWYSAQAEGPWITPPNRFVPGAIAYHLHSFSANTIRSDTGNWVGPMIAHGADATMGCVYEPYLALTPHEDIFTKRLLDGNYFAEAAYASIPGLSWMVTVVGDPLYRPFRVPLETALAAAGTPHSEHDDWLLLQQVRRDIIARQNQVNMDSLQQTLTVPEAGPVAEEGLGDLLDLVHDPHPGYSVDQAYKKAMAEYKLPIDRIRVGLKLAQYYSNHGQDPRAQAQLDMLRQLYPDDATRFGLVPLVPTTAATPSSGQPAPAADSNHEAPVVPPGVPRPPTPPQPVRVPDVP
jgi:uncharacterized protein (TIGR03790 family)